MGKDIVEKQKDSRYGDSLIKQLSKDLKAEFPDMKGFSLSNLKFIRQCYSFYNVPIEKRQRPVSQFDIVNVQQLVSQIPWGHNIKIVSKCKSIDEALFYINKTIEFGWSRDMLETQIGLNEFKRVGSSATNFALSLSPIQSDLAQQTLKDPYNFDFLRYRRTTKKES